MFFIDVELRSDVDGMPIGNFRCASIPRTGEVIEANIVNGAGVYEVTAIKHIAVDAHLKSGTDSVARVQVYCLPLDPRDPRARLPDKRGGLVGET